jgi:uncharacterized protein YcaQ
VADLAAYHGLLQRTVRHALPSTALVEVRVEGWSAPAYADPAALAALGGRARGRSIVLSPFDSLIWYRGRLERLFGLRHRLEAYTPKAQRKYGYFAMPVLGDTDIVGLVDPQRRGDVLVARQVTLFRPDGVRHVAAALGEAARWVGASSCEIERVEPASARAELVEAAQPA